MNPESDCTGNGAVRGDAASGVYLGLVVDDDAAVRFLLRQTLESIDIQVLEAGDGETALEVAREQRPDIILLDILMPGMDGFEVCERLRQCPGLLNTPILVMTGLDDMGSIDRAYQLGATDFTTKPLNWALLPHRVRYLLRASQAMEQALDSEALLKQAQGLAHIGHWEWNIPSGRLTWSDEVFRILGLQPQAFEPTYEAFLAHVAESDRERVRGAVDKAMADAAPYAIDHVLVKADGSLATVHEQGELHLDSEGNPLRMIGTVQDISERKRAEERIRQLAYYDDLTGLPNRTLFEDQVGHALAVARRSAESVVVMVLDLDHFRRLNDTLGHDFGDEFLKEFSATIRRCIRDGDYLARMFDGHDTPLARLGGDEFALLLNTHVDAPTVARVVERISQCLEQPFVVGEREIVVTASFGVAAFPSDGKDVNTLLKHADAAMYQAKVAGRSTFRFFQGEMQKEAMRRLSLEGELRKALERDELVLHYQPQLDMKSGRMVGAEALVRWQSAERGLVPPGDFIPVAEQFNLIGRIGRWVLTEACRQNRAWQEAGLPPLRMSVNLSAVQFRQAGLNAEIATCLADAQLDGGCLELELTESVLMNLSGHNLDTLNGFKEQGVSLSVDDFGTGYSSLTYLQQFPVDVLKVDRSFVSGIGENSDNTAIVAAVINLGHSLGLRVVAEGIETEEQMHFLKGAGCDIGQGFLIARPLPADEFMRLYQESLGA